MVAEDEKRLAYLYKMYCFILLLLYYFRSDPLKRPYDVLCRHRRTVVKRNRPKNENNNNY